MTDIFTYTPLGKTTLPVLLATMIMILVLNALWLIKSEKNHLKLNEAGKRTPLPLNIKRFLAFLMITISGFIACFAIDTYNVAKTHGFTEIVSTTMEQICTGIDNSPVESTLPTNINNTLIIYYRFGCEDCELIYSKLQSRLNNVNHVYWVATRSDQGKTLREQYPVSDVPSGVYIDETGKGHTLTLSHKYHDNDKTYVSLDTIHLNQLLKYFN